LDGKHSDFIYKSLTDIEKANLENTSPEFKYLMQEYHDGILLFDLTDKNVWSKAVKDSVGLKNFYEKNKEEYKIQIKADLSIFKYADKKALKKAEKILKDKAVQKYTDEEIVKQVADGDAEKFKLLTTGVFSKNDNPDADIIINGLRDGSIKKEQLYYVNEAANTITYFNNIIDSQGKPFEEIKGLVISDFQNDLEKKWIDQLKTKYPVKINDAVLNKIDK
jgi:peptidyl-prolyl cis-trans isomerase SurA